MRVCERASEILCENFGVSSTTYKGKKKVSNIYFFGLLAKMNIAIAQSLLVQILTKLFRFLKIF